MKKFNAFVKEKKSRADRFSWADGDVVAENSLEEWTHLEPKKREKDFEEKHQPVAGSPEHDSFMKHHISLDREHKMARDHYKSSSSALNHYLRHGEHRTDTTENKSPHAVHDMEKHYHEHIGHMDHVTSHKIEHHHTVFRGGVPKDETRFPVGHKFTDHGYTGASFHKSIAANFDYHRAKTKKDRKDIIHVIHVPPGTKGHYLDVHGDTPLSGEHELLMHRGTKFKVTHHTHTEDHHYIHSRVVGQHAKKFPELKKHKSTADDHGIVMTKHEDEKPEIKKKLGNLRPGQVGFHSDDPKEQAHHKDLIKSKVQKMDNHHHIKINLTDSQKTYLEKMKKIKL